MRYIRVLLYINALGLVISGFVYRLGRPESDYDSGRRTENDGTIGSDAELSVVFFRLLSLSS